MAKKYLDALNIHLDKWKFELEYFSKFKWIKKNPKLGDYIKIKCRNDGIEEVVGTYQGICSYKPYAMITTTTKTEYIFMESIIETEVLDHG